MIVHLNQWKYLSLKKIIQKQIKITLSNEGYKNKSIIDFKEIDSYKKYFNGYSLFEKN